MSAGTQLRGADLSCPKCGEPVLPGDAFCEGCGAQLVNASPGVDHAPDPAAPAPAAPGPGVSGPASAPGLGSGSGRACPCGSGVADPDGYCTDCGRLVPVERDHLEVDLGQLGGLVTDRGLRHSRNEDAGRLVTTADGGVLAVVADGVSTALDPQIASDVASAAVVRVLGPVAGPPTDAQLVAAVAAASDAVAGVTAPPPPPGGPPRPIVVPACTLVAACRSGAVIRVLNVGDSRAYWLPDVGPVELLTVEDSLAAEAIAAGIPPEIAYHAPGAHSITAWIGVDAGPLAPHLSRRDVTAPGTLIVCSDGLWNYLTDPAEFAAVVRRHLAGAAGSPIAAARSLTEFARAAGGHDNITVAVVPISEP